MTTRTSLGWRRLRFLVEKELLELRRDPRLFAIVLVAPVLQLTILGYAATTDIWNVPVVVADPERSPASRDLVARLDGSPYFSVVDVVTTVRQLDPYLETGRAWMALAIPPGYGRRVREGSGAVVQIIADGSDASSTTVALSYATTLVAAYADELAARRSVGTAGSPPGVGAAIRVWYNPRLESRDFMIPGVLALLLLVITANLTSMAIVRERERGTYEQLSVTPLGRWELIAGKLLPFAVIGLVDVVLVVAVAVFWFDVPFRGSLALLLGMSVVYLFTTLGLGLLVSTVSQTQQQAMMTTVFFFLLPMIFLSGFVFPIENMPREIQYVTFLVPLRYYLVIVRAIFLKGVGLETLWPQALALAGWGLAILALAVARSRKRLD
jgi:ABC-2 type transport system permease protein